MRCAVEEVRTATLPSGDRVGRRSTVVFIALFLLSACGVGSGRPDALFGPSPSVWSVRRPDRGEPGTPSDPSVSSSGQVSGGGASPSSVAAETTTTGFLVMGDVPNGPTRLPRDGPWTPVDSLPGVTTPGLRYRLADGLFVYLPLVEDQPHHILWTFTEQDRAIVEAYLKVWQVYVRSATRRPAHLDGVEFSRVTTDQGASWRSLFEPVERSGGHLDLADAIVLRPEVLGDHRSATTARVQDCVLDGSVFVDAHGALLSGSRRGVAPSGWAMDLQLVDGVWKGVRVGGAPAAC